jgi:hypothetical protein
MCQQGEMKSQLYLPMRLLTWVGLTTTVKCPKLRLTSIEILEVPINDIRYLPIMFSGIAYNQTMYATVEHIP